MTSHESDRRQRIVEFIADYTEAHWRPPTVREITSGVGLSSTAATAHHIQTLVRLGRLEQQPGARGLRVKVLHS